MAKLGELVLLEKLAYGGMAEVYRAKLSGYEGFEKIVAVKRILPHYAESKNFKKMFVHEANLSATLEHPNITHVYANGESEGYLYLVMEFIDGCNVRQLLQKAHKLKTLLPAEIACYIISEVLKGLEYAHNRSDNKGQPLNIVHRDISPQNIMLSYEGSVKIVDFGIAKVASGKESPKSKTLIGKFAYMSPEQAHGEDIDRRSDVYSAGIILWEMLTGTRLFLAEDEMKTLEKVKEGIVPVPSDITGYVPAALEKIVFKALEKNPNSRYSTSLEFYSDLTRYLNTRRTGFIPTDFTAFMKDFFKDEISAEKTERDKKPTSERIAIQSADLSGGSKSGSVSQSLPELPVDDTQVSFKGEKTVTASTHHENVVEKEEPTVASPVTQKIHIAPAAKETPARSILLNTVSSPNPEEWSITGIKELPAVSAADLNIKVIRDTSADSVPVRARAVKPPYEYKSRVWLRRSLWFFFFLILLAGAYVYIPFRELSVPSIPWAKIVKWRNEHFPPDDLPTPAPASTATSSDAQSVSSSAASVSSP